LCSSKPPLATNDQAVFVAHLLSYSSAPLSHALFSFFRFIGRLASSLVSSSAVPAPRPPLVKSGCRMFPPTRVRTIGPASKRVEQLQSSLFREDARRG
jgi:hypothetical protein